MPTPTPPHAPALRFGPTFAEMKDPVLLPPELRRSAHEVQDPLHPLNLFNLTWKEPGPQGPQSDAPYRIRHVVLPRQLTGVRANIVALLGKGFPSGSQKVGPVYSILVEKQLLGLVRPGHHTLVCPSTGNYGIGGAWVGPRMGYRSLVVMPQEMSRERFARIQAYGGEVIATPGCESNVKEIFDKVWELRRDDRNCVLEQFSEMGNYRFHYEVTGHALAELAADLATRGIGNGRAAAFVWAPGSGGTLAAGDRLKQVFPELAICGVEPIQCPTLYNVGFGGHRIEGIGDKHVTWIHNVHNMDYLFCVDDLSCLKGLQLLQEGAEVLCREAGVPEADMRALRGALGISGVCHILGAIKAAKVLGLGERDTVFTCFTDGFDRYPSVLERLSSELGPMTRDEALRRLAIFLGNGHGVALDYVLEGTRTVRERWHNQKYFTWVEQQGKSVAELQAQADPAYWLREQSLVAEIDAGIRRQRQPLSEIAHGAWG